jgi:large subunit ribosomal protein L16
MLPSMSYVPSMIPPGVIFPYKYPKRDIEMMGPERIHNQLIYRQYGIITLGGGALVGAHYDIIRDRINKYTNFERFFAIWRIEPPWKPVSQKSLGKKMGGGKTKVHHYELPVRAGRVLVEIGGIGQFYEIQRTLETICKKMPLYCVPISQETMDNLRAEKEKLDEENYNPFNYRYLVRNNFSNAQQHVRSRDMLWGGTYFG